jgi:hypothetical protein
MSDITLFSGNNVPDHIRNRQIDDVTASLAGGGGSKRISIRGKVFRLMDGGQQIAVNEDRAMNVVVVNAAPHVSRTFYEGTYEEGKNVPPDCWSADGITPASNAQNPQAASCADCPQNIKGSGQGDSRACRFSQRLAIVLENDISGDVYQLTLPSQSIFGKPEGDRMPMQAYAKYLKAQRTSITAVVTEAKFDINSSTPRLTFKAIRWLNEEELDNAIKQSKSPASLQAITMTVAQMDKVEEAAPAPAPKAEVKTAKESTATSEPTKRESKKPAVEEKQELSDVLAQWADD